MKVLEYWHKVSPNIMEYKDEERRIEATKTFLKRIDPDLIFQSLNGNVCRATKEITPTE